MNTRGAQKPSCWSSVKRDINSMLLNFNTDAVDITLHRFSSLINFIQMCTGSFSNKRILIK